MWLSLMFQSSFSNHFGWRLVADVLLAWPLPANASLSSLAYSMSPYANRRSLTSAPPAHMAAVRLSPPVLRLLSTSSTPSLLYWSGNASVSESGDQKMLPPAWNSLVPRLEIWLITPPVERPNSAP